MAANWRKVVVSGSVAELSKLSVDQSVSITGSLDASGSVFFEGLTNVAQPTIVSINPTTGQLFYQGTGSFTANSASFAISASQAENADTASSVGVLNQAVVISGSLAVNTSTGNSFDINADTFIFTGSLSTSGSVSFALPSQSLSYLVGYNPTTGLLAYAGTGSVVSVTASYAISSSQAISASFASTGNGSFSGSFSGSFTGNGSGITGVTASVLPNSLTQGTGITAFSFNGSAAQTVQVSGSNALSTESVVKWTGDAFANSSITDGALVTINNGGGVLIQQGGLYVTGASTFHDNVVMQGDLIVQGTASFQNSQNLAIADQFILLNSGSNTFQDSGFIINTGNTGNSGSAFFLETAATTTGTPLNGRFAVAGAVQPDATTVAAESYMNTTVITGSVPNDANPPSFGGSGLGQGNMWVNSNTSDIWIYA